MAGKHIQQPYGLWDSSITPVSLGRGYRLGDLAWDEGGSLVWWEGRAGRGVLVVCPPNGEARRDLNDEYAVRARLGYGGGDFAVTGGWVYFLEANASRIYRQPLAGGEARPVTPAFGSAAAPAVSPDGRWLVYVHSYEGEDCLALVDAQGEHWPQKLVSGADFYMQPTWQPGGERLAWVSWNHPNMPWDGTSLYLGRVGFSDHASGGMPGMLTPHALAGGESVAIFQPEFSPDGRYLAYVSDQTGWWQIYLYDLEADQHLQLTRAKAEHGLPAWQQNMRTYTFSPNGQEIYFVRNQAGYASLWRLALPDGEAERVAVPEEYTWLSQPAMAPDGSRLAMIASGGRTPERVIILDLEGKAQVVGRTTSESLPAEVYALPQGISWKSSEGGDVHGMYYAPHNPRYAGLGLPPLVVLIHGGPTGQRTAAFDRQVQFFTSRGYAVLQVNFRGSSGYGRAYREALRGQWGIYDVEDAVSGARHLVEAGQVDAERLVLMGSSSGGFTVLKALQDYPGFFKAGIDLYGISDHLSMVEDTHKFEAHLTDGLLGPLPDSIQIYRERSPINYVERIQDPLAIFQGADDPIVPPTQSERMATALKRRGVPVLYRTYPGEGHGFRREETVADLYQEIEKFLKTHVIYA